MYRGLTRLLAVATALVGLVMIVVTARNGGGVGYFLGTLFILAGLGRLFIVTRSPRG